VYLFPILVVSFIGENLLGSSATEFILETENIPLTEKGSTALEPQTEP
jgi:hypothetical protein